MELNRLPAWLQAYRDGHRQGNAQALAAYADYYCMDGSADMELDIEERLGYIPPADGLVCKPNRHTPQPRSNARGGLALTRFCGRGSAH